METTPSSSRRRPYVVLVAIQAFLCAGLWLLAYFQLAVQIPWEGKRFDEFGLVKPFLTKFAIGLSVWMNRQPLVWVMLGLILTALPFLIGIAFLQPRRPKWRGLYWVRAAIFVGLPALLNFVLFIAWYLPERKLSGLLEG